MKSRLTRVVMGLLVVALIAAIPANAALTDWPVTGTVTDTAGNPLEDVRITDGSHSAWTNGSGYYEIQEPILTDFVLTASKAGYRPESTAVFLIPCTGVDEIPCTKPVDFVLKRTDE